MIEDQPQRAGAIDTLEPMVRLAIETKTVRVGERWALDVSCERTSTFVCLEPDGPWAPSDNWFHLPPGVTRRIGVSPVADALEPPSARPSGSVRALDSRLERRIDG